jgi:hypothetical protein
MSRYGRQFGPCGAVALLLAVFASSARAQSIDSTDVRTTWLNISSCSLTAHLFPNDTFALKGSFNIAPLALDSTSADVTLNVGKLRVAFSHDLWKRVGKTTTYRASAKNVSAQIAWWAGGSSRCNFSFIATKQNLSDGLDLSFSHSSLETTVRLRVGAAVDETVRMALTLHSVSLLSVSAKLSSFRESSDPMFALDSVSITRNLKKAGRDSLKITGRVWAGSFNPAKHDIAVDLGTFHGTLLTPKTSCAMNMLTGKFSISFRNVDLNSVADPDILSLQFAGVPDAWHFLLHFREIAKHTSYKY